MNFENPISSLIEAELLLTELWSAGQHLDAVDAGRVAVDAGRYQRAASKARLLMKTCASNPRLATIIAASPALKELSGL